MMSHFLIAGVTEIQISIIYGSNNRRGMELLECGVAVVGAGHGPLLLGALRLLLPTRILDTLVVLIDRYRCRDVLRTRCGHSPIFFDGEGQSL